MWSPGAYANMEPGLSSPFAIFLGSVVSATAWSVHDSHSRSPRIFSFSLSTVRCSYGLRLPKEAI